MTWVFAYDVSEDHLREKVAHVLEQFGERVQKSVFECRLEPADLERLTKRLEEALEDPKNGNIRAYRACADCLHLSFGIGDAVPIPSSRPCTIV